MPEDTKLQLEELALKHLKSSIRHSIKKEMRQVIKLNGVLGNTSFTPKTSFFRTAWARGNKTILPRLPLMQRSSVMVRYSANKLPGNWAAHGSYLVRENAQHDNKRGAGFNAQDNAVDIELVLDGWQKAGDERLWKIIISPEFGDRLDLREHTCQLIAEMEGYLGTALEWVAIDHYNTDNPHVHLLIRGRSASGNPLMLERGYINEGLRTQSRIIATRQLGYRTEHDIFLARERQITSDRFTELDKELISKSVSAPQGYMFTLQGDKHDYRQQLIKRLKKLESLQLATYQQNHTWLLPSDIEKKLHMLGHSAGQMKILDRHRHFLSNQAQPMVRTELKKLHDRLTGIILGSGIDPETDNPYLLIEAIDGKAHFITQSAKIQEMRLQESIKNGDVISIEIQSTLYQGKTAPQFYPRICSYGKSRVALQDNALLDAEIIHAAKHKHPIIPLAKEGFAGLFQQARSERIATLIENNILAQQNCESTIINNVENYAAFRMSELQAAMQLPQAVKEWKSQHQPMLVGKIIYSDPMFTILHCLDGSYQHFVTPMDSLITLEKGMEIVTEAKLKAKDNLFITILEHHNLIALSQEKLTLADRIIGTSPLPDNSPMPEVLELLKERAALWKARNINPRSSYYFKEAKEWLAKQNQSLER
jgi:type IV secretory pathway VirD2 relaxase